MAKHIIIVQNGTRKHLTEATARGMFEIPVYYDIDKQLEEGIPSFEDHRLECVQGVTLLGFCQGYIESQGNGHPLIINLTKLHWRMKSVCVWSRRDNVFEKNKARFMR